MLIFTAKLTLNYVEGEKAKMASQEAVQTVHSYTHGPYTVEAF